MDLASDVFGTRYDRSLYEYLSGAMTGLDGLTHIESAPVMQFVKMHATMALGQA